MVSPCGDDFFVGATFGRPPYRPTVLRYPHIISTFWCYGLPCRKIAPLFADFTPYKDIA